MKKNVYNIILAVLLGIGSFTIGRITDWSLFTIESGLPLFDLISIMVNVLLAVYIARIIDKDLQNSQNGKQIFIERISQCEQMLSTLNDLVSEDKSLFVKITSLVNRLKKCVNTTLKEIEADTEHFEGLTLDPEISNAVISLRDLLTNTPVDKNDKSQIHMEEDKVTYSPARKELIYTKISVIENKLFVLKNKIVYQ